MLVRINTSHVKRALGPETSDRRFRADDWGDEQDLYARRIMDDELLDENGQAKRVIQGLPTRSAANRQVRPRLVDPFGTDEQILG